MYIMWVVVLVLVAIFLGFILLALFRQLVIVASGVIPTMATGLSILGGWVLIRISLIFPGAAVDAPVGIGTSWEATRPVALPLLLVVIAAWLMQTAVNFGVWQLSQQAGLAPQSGPHWAMVVTSALLQWIYLFFGLSFVTLLYDRLIGVEDTDTVQAPPNT